MPSGYKYVDGKWVFVQGGEPAVDTSTQPGGTGTGADDAPKGGDNSLSANDTEIKQEYNDIKIKVLNATANLVVTANTFNLISGDTVAIGGVGNTVGGNYLIVGNRFSIDGSSGLTQELSLFKFEDDASVIVPRPQPDPAPPKQAAPTKTPAYVRPKGVKKDTIAMFDISKKGSPLKVYTVSKEKATLASFEDLSNQFKVQANIKTAAANPMMVVPAKLLAPVPTYKPPTLVVVDTKKKK